MIAALLRARILMRPFRWLASLLAPFRHAPEASGAAVQQPTPPTRPTHPYISNRLQQAKRVMTGPSEAERVNKVQNWGFCRTLPQALLVHRPIIG